MNFAKFQRAPILHGSMTITPWAITFQLIAPGTIHPGQLFPQAIAPRTIILPPGQLPPIPIAPRILP